MVELAPKMPYISPVYKDTINDEEYNSEETYHKCREEESKGNIPVMIRWNRRHIKFFVSGDVSINDILASFRYNDLKNVNDNEKILYLTHSPDHHQYENGTIFHNYSSPLKDIFEGKKIMILFMNNQNDRD